MILDDWLAQRAQTSPDRVALTFEGLELTYEELEAAASTAARRLAARGVRREADVVLSMPAGPDYVILLHALIKLGAVVCPLDPRLGKAEYEDRLDILRPLLVVNSTDGLAGTEADLPLLGEHDMDALQCRMMTSGTTRTPHAIGLTYGNHLWSAVGPRSTSGSTPADRWLCCLPLFHVSGLSIVMRSRLYGTGVVIHDGFDVDAVAASLRLRTASRWSHWSRRSWSGCWKPTPSSGRPARSSWAVGRFRSSRWRRRPAAAQRVVQAYGMTETTSQVDPFGDGRRRAQGRLGRAALFSCRR